MYWKIRSILQRLQITFRSLRILFHAANRAKEISGKGCIARFYEILVLRFSRGKSDPEEYYYYGLYNDKEYSLSGKKKFIGLGVGAEINDLLNFEEWRAVANDKLVLYSILQGIGLPSPEMYAVYRYPSGFFGAVPCLTDAD